MITGVVEVLGSIGIFLIGMAVMTEGLRNLAGDSLRKALAKFTISPVTGAVSGAIATALLQSSSATTVMAVGFAGAGLLTFPQTLGVIFGANIGTTITGWLVALVGFKFHLAQVVMPLVFVGALMRLLGKKRVAALGYALAGFGLIFVGISMLQYTMEQYRDFVTPQSFPPDTVLGRALLVLIGVAVTLVTQSSSAGVATAITAVYVGTLSLPQAAAMVIGMNVGTTCTAAMAAVGGNVNARRTGLAHVIYNLITGIGAFLCLPLYVKAWDVFAPAAVQSDPEIALVAFHTLFNFFGVVVALPLTQRFASLIELIVPARESELTRRLEPSFMSHADVAIDSVVATERELTQIIFRRLASALDKRIERHADDPNLDEIASALRETRIYLSQVKTSSDDGETHARAVAAMHVVDHLTRLLRRCQTDERLNRMRVEKDLRDMAARIAGVLLVSGQSDEALTQRDQDLEAIWKQLHQRIEPFRRETIEKTARGEMTTDETLKDLDAIRWLRRVCYHAWRIAYHLNPSRQVPVRAADSEEMIEDDPAVHQ